MHKKEEDVEGRLLAICVFFLCTRAFRVPVIMLNEIHFNQNMMNFLEKCIILEIEKNYQYNLS